MDGISVLHWCRPPGTGTLRTITNMETSGMEYTVTLQPSGHRYQCGPETEILKAGLAAGLFMPYSCRAGVCNTCRGRVVDGRVDWGGVHPRYLSEEDRSKGFALLCQATPRSDV